MERSQQEKMKIAICSLLLFSLTVLGPTTEASELTYADLVERLYDMTALAIPPVSGEQSGCFSSRDRGARYDEDQEQAIHVQQATNANADHAASVAGNKRRVLRHPLSGHAPQAVSCHLV